MTRRSNAQLNIRSDKARQRVADLVRETGRTATQVVEEALQSYRPQPSAVREPAPEGLEWRGRFLVGKPSGKPSITADDLLQAIEDGRDDRVRNILGDDGA